MEHPTINLINLFTIQVRKSWSINYLGWLVLPNYLKPYSAAQSRCKIWIVWSASMHYGFQLVTSAPAELPEPLKCKYLPWFCSLFFSPDPVSDSHLNINDYLSLIFCQSSLSAAACFGTWHWKQTLPRDTSAMNYWKGAHTVKTRRWHGLNSLQEATKRDIDMPLWRSFVESMSQRKQNDP